MHWIFTAISTLPMVFDQAVETAYEKQSDLIIGMIKKVEKETTIEIRAQLPAFKNLAQLDRERRSFEAVMDMNDKAEFQKIRNQIDKQANDSIQLLIEAAKINLRARLLHLDAEFSAGEKHFLPALKELSAAQASVGEAMVISSRSQVLESSNAKLSEDLAKILKNYRKK